MNKLKLVALLYDALTECEDQIAATSIDAEHVVLTSASQRINSTIKELEEA